MYVARYIHLPTRVQKGRLLAIACSESFFGHMSCMSLPIRARCFYGIGMFHFEVPEDGGNELTLVNHK